MGDKFRVLEKIGPNTKEHLPRKYLNSSNLPLVDNLSTCLEYPTWLAITINFIFRKRAHKVYVLCNELAWFASMQNRGGK